MLLICATYGHPAGHGDADRSASDPLLSTRALAGVLRKERVRLPRSILYERASISTGHLGLAKEA